MCIFVYVHQNAGTYKGQRGRSLELGLWTGGVNQTWILWKTVSLSTTDPSLKLPSALPPRMSLLIILLLLLQWGWGHNHVSLGSFPEKFRKSFLRVQPLERLPWQEPCCQQLMCFPLVPHSSCIDSWFEVNRSCPEHPAD